MMQRAHVIVWLMMLGTTLGLLCGCQVQRSSRLTVDDIALLGDEVAADLAQSDFLRGRTADSPRIALIMSPAENLSSDIFTDGELWMIVAQLRASLPIRTLMQQHNIVMIDPRIESPQPLSQTQSLHTLSATVRSLRRAAAVEQADQTDHRAETYQIEYHITDLQSRATRWSQTFMIRREAKGVLYD